ncbi:PqqD family protein [Salipaludibacillus keqinensis]|uniref:PqqD family protein n=1 Tax=Salipaludibacillus keqinensis TaxID=2045207 RepID=A0A323TKM0_9BACI|nr:lasso peptide biosynthesis PqqD family chaperone [Salipaludibacillus keqinensis]PYZ94646.1 PqqD family protein [Salipaludibacillus keqinensis]
MLNQSAVDLTHYISQKEGNIVSDMDGEKVMLSVNNGKYYNLGVMGGEIWDMLHQPISIELIVEELLNRYDVDYEQCKHQVLTFLDKLRDESLIEITPNK